jgi:predicted RecB family endonuclease
LSYEVKITQTTKFNDLKKILDSKLERGFTSMLRLFNFEGVEMMEDDLEFVKAGATLYASKGKKLYLYIF